MRCLYNITVANNTQHFEDSDIDIKIGKVLIWAKFGIIWLLENSSVDLYASVRSLYLQDRFRKVRNIDKTTETLSDDDWEELDSQ